MFVVVQVIEHAGCRWRRRGGECGGRCVERDACARSGGGGGVLGGRGLGLRVHEGVEIVCHGGGGARLQAVTGA